MVRKTPRASPNANGNCITIQIVYSIRTLYTNRTYNMSVNVDVEFL